MLRYLFPLMLLFGLLTYGVVRADDAPNSADSPVDSQCVSMLRLVGVAAIDSPQLFEMMHELDSLKHPTQSSRSAARLIQKHLAKLDSEAGALLLYCKGQPGDEVPPAEDEALRVKIRLGMLLAFTYDIEETARAAQADARARKH